MHKSLFNKMFKRKPFPFWHGLSFASKIGTGVTCTQVCTAQPVGGRLFFYVIVVLAFPHSVWWGDPCQIIHTSDRLRFESAGCFDSILSESMLWWITARTLYALLCKSLSQTGLFLFLDFVLIRMEWLYIILKHLDELAAVGWKCHYSVGLSRIFVVVVFGV